MNVQYLTNRILEIRENIHRNYSKSLLPVLLFDLSIILPLPQAWVFITQIQGMSGQDFFSVMNVFVVQHVLRVIRLCKLIEKRKNSDKLTKWAKRTFNIFYLHAANVSLLAS